MTASARPHLHVVGDLRLDIDGVEAEVTGSGGQVSISTDHPYLLVRRSLGRPDGATRSRLAQLADALNQSGMTVEVIGPHGRIAAAGAGVTSAAARILTGSDSVRLTIPIRRLLLISCVTGAVLGGAVARGSRRRRRGKMDR